MKLVIDLSNKEADSQLRAAIDAKVGEITAEAIQKIVDATVSTKLSRLTEERIDQLAREELRKKIEQLTKSERWGQPSMLEKTVGEIAVKVVKEALKN